jgi:hypothetical protein
MHKQTLTQDQSWNAAYIFLRALWNQNPEKLVRSGIGLGAYLNFANSDFKDDFDWRRAYTTVLQHAWIDNDNLSSNDIFKITALLVKKYKQKYGFDLSPVENLFSEMEKDPSHILWNTWKLALKEASQGTKRIWLGDYRFSDWCNKT